MSRSDIAPPCSPASTLVPDPSQALDAEIASLVTLDLSELRSHWRRRLRTNAPSTLPRALLLRLLAYRLQAKVLGDLDAATAKYLHRIAVDHAKRRDAGVKKKPKSVPPVPAVPRREGLKPGTMLLREHAGTMHRVTVISDGFAWQGKRYSSLSEIARAITGTKWNGPRFFGLRDKKPSMIMEESAV